MPTKKVNDIMKNILQEDKFEFFTKKANELTEKMNKMVTEDKKPSLVFCSIIDELKKNASFNKKYLELLDLCYNKEKCGALFEFIDKALGADSKEKNSTEKELFKLFVLSYKPEALEWCSGNKWDCERLALSICDLLYSMARLFNNKQNERKYYFPCVPMLGDILLLAYYLGGDTDVNIDEIKLNIKVPSNNEIVSINLRKEYFS